MPLTAMLQELRHLLLNLKNRGLAVMTPCSSLSHYPHHYRPITMGLWLQCCVSGAMFLFPSFKFILFIWFLLLLLLLFPGPWHCDTRPVTPYCVLLPWVVCWQVFTLPTLMCLPTVERWSRQVLWQVWGASDSTFYYDEEFRVHDEPDGSGVRKLVVLSKREHG